MEEYLHIEKYLSFFYRYIITHLLKILEIEYIARPLTTFYSIK